MAFLQDEEKAALTIRRMIFHAVGRDVEELILLPEIDPPQQTGFFIDRIRSALTGNLFSFRDGSNAESVLRSIADGGDFTTATQALARDFHTRHGTGTSSGCFFVFELDVGAAAPVYALIKYDHDEAIHYSFAAAGAAPLLERLHQAFVRKPEAMQKIALVRLDPVTGGRIMVRDRSKRTHISEYFEGFLNARRVNEPSDLSGKLVEAFKATFKACKGFLPPDIQEGGVNRIYEVLRQGGHAYDPEAPEALVTAVLGQVPEGGKVRARLERELRNHGVAEETFEIDPERVRKPRRRIVETEEGTQVLYDEEHPPLIEPTGDGRQRIEIVTAGIKRHDVDTEKRPRVR